MVKILFNEIPKKNRQELLPANMGKENYYDTEYLKDILEKQAGPEDTCRVRLVRTYPFPAYRLTVLRKHKSSHTKTDKNGDKVTLKPGWYELKTWFAERFIDGFVFTPEMPEGVDNVS